MKRFAIILVIFSLTFLWCASAMAQVAIDYSGKEFNELVDYNYWLKSPHEGVEVDSSILYFNKYSHSVIFHYPVSFTGAKFNSKAEFWSAKFDSFVIFKDAIFCNEVTFYKSNFKSEASFYNVTFDSTAVFRNTHFRFNAIFARDKFYFDANFQFAEYN
ncbi:MAG: hypothetical protein J7K40_02070 [candidate division Zixibacteria bacterium]|nr:hypothetical protein [candidate division Zixibacteria bacterium]